MTKKLFEIESSKPFSESLIWQINRDYYQETGIDAWSDSIVPHSMTSNSRVGKTYAELIVGFLKDLAHLGKSKETVYILELGAGHGRLAFHVLKHIEKIVKTIDIELPSYCYILSDIVENNLDFFHGHPQFKSYYETGKLDLAYFDGMESKEICLRHSKKRIEINSLAQPLIAIANYFFDTLPNDVFFIKDDMISSCSVSLHSETNPTDLNAAAVLKSLIPRYTTSAIKHSLYDNPIYNEILTSYQKALSYTYLFFPIKGLECISNLQNFSKAGLMLLTMDKGFSEMIDLNKRGVPDVVTHGSFSLWVNYHALGSFCEKQNGKALFSSYSNFHLEIGCLLFSNNKNTYRNTQIAYDDFINDFGPDNYTTIKKMAYGNIKSLTLPEMFALIKLSFYDSTLFVHFLSRIKELMKTITLKERLRLLQTIDETWDMYFDINESIDLGYELGGLLYDLGAYERALIYFQYSVDFYGAKADIYYNQILCYYQLRQDNNFTQTLIQAKNAFPNFSKFEHLDSLDLAAI